MYIYINPVGGSARTLGVVAGCVGGWTCWNTTSTHSHSFGDTNEEETKE